MNSPDGLAEEVGDGEHGELREAVHRHGVGDDHLLEEAAGEPLERGRAEDRVGAAGVHSSRSLLVQQLSAPLEMVPAVSIMSSTMMATFPLTSPMRFTTSAWLWPGRLLSTMASGASESFLAKARALATPPTFRRHHHHVLGADGLAGQVVEDDGLAVDVVHGDVEVADGLARVEVAGQHAVGAGLRDEVGHQLGGDGAAAPLHLPVGPGVAEVGDDGGDVLGGGPPAGVDHDEELHEVLVGGRAGGLHQEHVAATHALLQLHVDLAIREPLDLDLAQLHPKVARDLLRQHRVGAAGEDAQASAAAGRRWDWEWQG